MSLELEAKIVILEKEKQDLKNEISALKREVNNLKCSISEAHGANQLAKELFENAFGILIERLK